MLSGFDLVLFTALFVVNTLYLLRRRTRLVTRRLRTGPSSPYMDSSLRSTESVTDGGGAHPVQSYIRPVCGALWAPGHHGKSSTAGHSWYRRRAPGLLSA